MQRIFAFMEVAGMIEVFVRVAVRMMMIVVHTKSGLKKA